MELWLRCGWRDPCTHRRDVCQLASARRPRPPSGVGWVLATEPSVPPAAAPVHASEVSVHRYALRRQGAGCLSESAELPMLQGVVMALDDLAAAIAVPMPCCDANHRIMSRGRRYVALGHWLTTLSVKQFDVTTVVRRVWARWIGAGVHRRLRQGTSPSLHTQMPSRET